MKTECTLIENSMFMTSEGYYIYSVGSIDSENDVFELLILTPDLITVKSKPYSISYFQEQIADGRVVPYEKC